MTTWQPIETVPPNTAVLVYVPHTDHYGAGIWRSILVDLGTGPHWHSTGLHVGRDHSPDLQPICWMPLPDVPDAQSDLVVSAALARGECEEIMPEDQR